MICSLLLIVLLLTGMTGGCQGSADKTDKVYSGSFTENLDKDGRHQRNIKFVVPAGMEIEVVLEELDGHLRTYHLLVVGEDGEQYVAVHGGFVDSPGARWYYTGYNRKPTTYIISLYGWKYEEQQSGIYQIRVRTHDRGDLGRHSDAGIALKDRLDLPPGQVVEGNLFASLTSGDRDFSDWFRIPDVRAGYTIRAQLLTVEEFGGSDPREIRKLSQPDRVSLSIYQPWHNERGEYEDRVVKWGEQYLPVKTELAILEHTAEEAGDYYVVIERQGTWNASYTVRVDVISGPENEECNRLLEEYRQKHREYLEFAGAISFAQRFDEVNEAIKMVKETMDTTEEETSSFAEKVDRVGKLLNKVDRSNGKLKEFLEGVKGGLESSSNLMGEANEALDKIDTAMGILEEVISAQEASPSEVLAAFANYFEKVTDTIGPLVDGIPVLGVFLDLYIDGIRACTQSAEQIEKVVEERNRIYEHLTGREHLYIRPSTPQERQLQKKREMEEELKSLSQKLLEECGIDVTEEEEEAADPSVYDAINQAADEARRQCAAQDRAYYDAQKVEHDLKQQQRDQLATREYFERAMQEIQPAYEELMRLRSELQALLSVEYQDGMTDEEKREVLEKLERRHALESYIVPNQEREVTDYVQKWKADSYEELRSSHDQTVAALEETQGQIAAAIAMRIRAHEEWIQCQREYLLEQARSNGWRESDLRVDYGHLFR